MLSNLDKVCTFCAVGMKGGFYGVRLRGKQISLVLVALVCTTVLLWSWDKTSILTSLRPPQNLRPEILLGAPVLSSISSKPHIQVNKDAFTGSKKDKINEQKEQQVDLLASVAQSPPEVSNDNTNSIITPSTKEEIVMKVEVEVETPQISEEVKIKQEKQTGDITSPDGSAIKVGTKDQKNMTNTIHHTCNYAKGKWVSDNSRPLYSGFGCKQWLSDMWACRLTQRTDFEYEKLRWQPKDCKMEDFERSKFLKRMQHKTIAIIGDSLGRQQFQSLMCMVTGGQESSNVHNVGREYGLVKARGAIRPDGWAYRFPATNTTILYYWSASLTDLSPLDTTNPLTDYAMHLDRPPYFLQQFIPKFDVLVLNTGHHWNRGKLQANRWVMHVNGVPNTDRKIADIGGAKNFTIHSIVKWVDSQLPKYPWLKAFYRTLSPRHFFNGDWNTGGSCDNTTPSEGKEVLNEESSDGVAAGAVKGTRVKLLDITGPSELRDEGHISRYSIKATPGVQDCLHWCLPGVPDTWNEMLYAQL